MTLRTPVVFMIFNRPDLTARVFAEIARARPQTLLVIADGPRQGKEGEEEKCRAARATIEKVDWPCEVVKNYAETNLGCRNRVSSGLSWAFETVPEAIVLEDDCLPAPSFFPFCETLLERYREDERVMHIGGSNLVAANQQSPYSYYFSRYVHVWGWASWRRAWRHYRPQMPAWSECRQNGFLGPILSGPKEVRYWTRLFDKTLAGAIDTWDYQWLFACWLRGGLAVIPSRNLISNIGFRADAAHTIRFDARLAELPPSHGFALTHPPISQRDQDADRRSFHQLFQGDGGQFKSFYAHFIKLFKHRWPSIGNFTSA